MPGASFAQDLVRWQRSHGRHTLPWQGSRDPYRVWLSEIMLQQTQVATVLGYYERFLTRFPDVASLAAASSDDVLALWAGLGYYSRARNLHRCAQAVVRDHGGHFPRRADGLVQLPGIGRSTAAAIASFCFDERVAILDGNVKRVLTRVLAFDGDLAQAAQERRLWDRATDLLPEDAQDMPAYTQGLMDLGATVCTTRSPQCLLCPMQTRCEARRTDRPEAYPVRTRKLKRQQRENWLLWLVAGDAVWLQRRADTGIWAGLWSLPLFDAADAAQHAALALAGVWQPGPAALTQRPGFLHVLTHLDWTLHPLRVELDAPALLAAEGDLADPADGSALNRHRAPAQLEPILGAGRWWRRAELADVGLPAPLRKLLDAG